MSSKHNHINLVKPWHPVNSNKEYLKAELLKTLSVNHILYGKKLVAIAYRQDMEEVLFEIIDSKSQYAIVHLTHQFEVDPKWPSTQLYNDWQDVDVRLQNDHKGWEDDVDDD